MKRIPVCDECDCQDFSVRIARSPQGIELVKASEYFRPRSKAAVTSMLIYTTRVAQCKVCGAEYEWTDD